jgi:thiosulfate reductase/polysulfide reductase chain A
VVTTQREADSGGALRPGLVELSISRRRFLARAGAALVGAAAVAGGKAKAFAGTTLNRFGIKTPWFNRGEVVTTYGVCDICPWRCGIIVHSVDGVVQKIDGNPLDPKSRGRLCARGQGGISFTMDPDRLKTPLIRTGERGSGEFREAGWTEALDEAAAKIAAIRDEYGAESVAVFAHTASDHWFADYFAQAFGTPNAAKPSSSLCLSPRDEASSLTFGFSVGGHEPVDWDGLECLALVGSHVGEDARNTLMQDFGALRDRPGSKIIVIDPRLSSAATKADHWLPIKPGTDTALLLAWIHVMIEENLYDAEYVAEWTTGFEELAAHVADMTPEWAAEITDLEPAAIRETARAMAASAPRSVIMPGRHTTWYGNDSQRMRTVYLVNALLGAYGREGGMYFNKSAFLDAYPHPPFLVAGSAGGCSAGPAEVSDELPLGPTGKARADGARETFLRGATAMQELIDPMISGEPYPIKALIVSGVNLLHSVPNPEKTKQALAALDFVLVVDVLPQEHVAWADVVLPEATYLERTEDLSTIAHKTPFIQLREAAMEPMYDTKPGWWISRELGTRLDLGAFYRWETIEEWVDRRLISVASSMEKMRAAGGVLVQNGAPYLEDHDDSPFSTASGKIELFSDALADAGFDPIPVYEEIEQPEPGWYRLLYGRHPVHTFAKTQNTPVLSGLFPENELWLNASEAAAAGVVSGDRVWLENQDGARSGPILVKATERIRRDAVFMAHGFGHAANGLTNANGRGASDTKLQTRYRLDPISGGAGMRVNFVKIVKEV